MNKVMIIASLGFISGVVIGYIVTNGKVVKEKENIKQKYETLRYQCDQVRTTPVTYVNYK